MVDRQTETLKAPPAHCSSRFWPLEVSRAQPQPQSKGRRERERTSRKLWDVIDDCEQGGDLGVICSEAVDPLRGRLEGI